MDSIKEFLLGLIVYGFVGLFLLFIVVNFIIHPIGMLLVAGIVVTTVGFVHWLCSES